MALPRAVAAVFNVAVRVARSTTALPLPMPVHAMPESTNPVGGAFSEIAVVAPVVVSSWRGPATGVPGVTVMMPCATMPLLPLNPNVPTAPVLVLRTTSDGLGVLVIVHTIWSPAAGVTFQVGELPDGVNPTPLRVHWIEGTYADSGQTLPPAMLSRR